MKAMLEIVKMDVSDIVTTSVCKPPQGALCFEDED